MAKNKQDNFDAELDAAASAAPDTIKILSRRPGDIQYAGGVLKFDEIKEFPRELGELLVKMHPGELRVI